MGPRLGCRCSTSPREPGTRRASLLDHLGNHVLIGGAVTGMHQLSCGFAGQLLYGECATTVARMSGRDVRN